MKFYLCQTEVGPQYEHLQATAKQRDPKFEVVELDFSKQPMMDLLNRLMRQAHGHSTEQPAASPEEQEALPPAAPVPPAPKTKPQSLPPHAARNDAQIAWEEFILDIPAKESYRLDALQRMLATRRAEIEKGENA